MKLSEIEKQELITFSKTNDFSSLEKVVIAENAGSEEATRQFTDFIQFFHNMADHPTRKFKPINGVFLL